jgi:hypothetical protein
MSVRSVEELLWPLDLFCRQQIDGLIVAKQTA